MAIIKCKMCGGDLEILDGLTVAECEYCGSKQTLPNVDDEKKLNLFQRANRLRFGCEFDKAAGVYESIVADFPEEAEAYWGLVLCKYGIEYVDDPATAKKIPTCHRSSFDSVMDDANFELVMEYADAVARSVYREEAKAIEELRKGIIEVSGKEEPYDIFICYKETDENGERTIDSVLAQDVYDALCEKGYRMFFSRITLEDKLGQEYEPYIFAALNSAKVMLAFGTSYDYYNAVWVKNEWSRYLQLMTQDKSKHLIPCYKDIDAYDMPKEFAKLQAQDMGKVGAIQDLLRGIEKLIGTKVEEPKETIVREVVSTGGANVESLIKRGYMALEDKKWDEAKDFFNRALDINAECADGYLGNALVWFKAVNVDDITNHFVKPDDFVEFEEDVTIFTDGDRKEHELIIGQNIVPYYLDEESLEKLFRFNDGYKYVTDETLETLEYEKRKLENKDLQRAYEYGDDTLKGKIDAIRNKIISMYEEAEANIEQTNNANKEAKLSQYHSFLGKTKEKIAELKKNAEEQREKDYQNAIKLFEEGEFSKASDLFYDPKLVNYKESRLYAKKCDDEMQKIRKEKTEQIKAERKEKITKLVTLFLTVAIGIIVFVIILNTVMLVRSTPRLLL